MLDLLVLTVILPLLGAASILALSSLLSRLHVDSRYVKGLVGALAIAIVLLASVLAFGSGDGSRVVLSSSYPSLLTESAVEMRWDGTLWPLGLSLSVVAGALLLEVIGRDERSFHEVAASLLLVAAALAALWSANPFTTIVCWAFYDVAFALGRIAAGTRRQVAVRSLALGTAAGLLLWAGMLVAEGGIGGVQWALMPPGGAKMTYWMLAGLLRLGVYPLHVSSPRSVSSGSSLVGVLLLGPILGWGLWIRLALIGDRVLPVGMWTVIPALLTLVAGGLLAWTANRPRNSLPWISMAANGTVILAAVLVSLWGKGQVATGGVVVATMTLGSVGWMLATTVLLLGGGIDLRQIFRWEASLRSVALLIGGLSLVSAPVTAGFMGESALIGELIGAGRWGWSAAYLIGRAFLVAAVVRWLLAPDPVEGKGEGLLGKTARALGLVGLAVVLAAVGLAPAFFLTDGGRFPTASLGSLLAAPGLAGWLLWGGSLLIGGTLAWLDARFRPRIALWLDALHDVVLLDWGYELLMGAFEQGFGLLRVADTVLSGRGALLWSCIVLLMAVLIIGG